MDISACADAAANNSGLVSTRSLRRSDRICGEAPQIKAVALPPFENCKIFKINDINKHDQMGGKNLSILIVMLTTLIQIKQSFKKNKIEVHGTIQI